MNQTGQNTGSEAAVGHVMNEYLARSATFIHTRLRFQERFRPVVLARRTANLDEFPLESVETIVPQSKTYEVLASRIPALAKLTYYSRLAFKARGHGCALLHGHFGWAACDSLAPGRILRIPVVATFYGLDLAPFYPLRYPYSRLFAEGSLIFCEGPAMAEHLQKLGCPQAKIRIVKIGLDLEHFPFAPRERTSPLVIVQAARFVEKKGVDLSIRAFAAARPDLGPSELWLVGDGPLRPQVDALISELGVLGSVRLPGLVSHAEYRDLIRRAHICIQPSRTASDGDTEGGAPTVLLEMQAAGIPVVSTRHADIPQVVAVPEELVEEEDVEGLARALVRLARFSDAEWQERALQGRALIEAEHDARSIARRLEDLYDEASRVHRSTVMSD
jgi:colanic acid/amylovoran biosynthesis glycosyltransferase